MKKPNFHIIRKEFVKVVTDRSRHSEDPTRYKLPSLGITETEEIMHKHDP